MPKNPRSPYGSTLASTKSKRKLLRLRQHSPNSGVQVNALNRIYSRLGRLTLLSRTTGNQGLVKGSTSALFSGFFTSLVPKDSFTVNVVQVSGPNTAVLAQGQVKGELDISATGLISGVYLFKFTAQGLPSKASGTISMWITNP